MYMRKRAVEGGGRENEEVSDRCGRQKLHNFYTLLNLNRVLQRFLLLFSLFQALWCLRLKGKKNDTKVAQYILCQICLHMETTIWVCSLLLQLSYLLLRFCHTVLKANCCSEHLASVPVSSSLTLHCVKMISYFLHDSAWRERRL